MAAVRQNTLWQQHGIVVKVTRDGNTGGNRLSFFVHRMDQESRQPYRRAVIRVRGSRVYERMSRKGHGKVRRKPFER